MKYGFQSALAAAVMIAAGCAHAEPAPTPRLEAALREVDVASIHRIAADAAQPRAERALAEGVLDYWRLQDDAAGPLLENASTDAALTPALRRLASIILSGLRLRQSRYADSLAALDAALPGETDADIRADMEQTRTFIEPLVGAPRMEARVGAPAEVALTRDLTSHWRAAVGINDGDLDAIIDTGSGVSTMSLSNARRLGLHMLTGQASVGTATSQNVTTGLAIADKVTIGGAEFRNVVFLVMPDEALTFANGAYVVQGIIGLPLLMPLGRLEFTKTGDGSTETLHYGPSAGRADAGSNLLADGVEAVALAHVDEGRRALHFFVDNGAPHSHLNRRFVADFPDLAATGVRQAVTTSGGGGSETQEDAMRLPSLTLLFGESSASVSNVPVIDDHHNTRHGDIGLDFLESGRGYVLDFQAMRLELLH